MDFSNIPRKEMFKLFLMKIDLKYILAVFFSCVVIGIANGQVVQLGSGTAVTSSTDVSPINTYFSSVHYQVTYTGVELQAAGAAAGNISKLGFYIATAPLYNLPNFTIKLKHTTETEVGITVYTNPLYAPSIGGFDMLDLSTPFLWNGIDDILVEVCFDPVESFDASGTVRYYEETDAVKYYRTDGVSTCSTPVQDFSNQKPQLQLEVTAPSDFDIKPKFLSNFTICAGSNDIYTAVNNLGLNDLTTATLSWEVNGILQSTINPSFNPAITTGGLGDSVLLGSFNFSAGQSYTIKIWTSNPNGNTDKNTTNDTITTTLSTSLAGEYTIGGTNPDFPTFTAAITALTTQGICDSVIFKVREGTYTEDISISPFTGSSLINTVTFKAEGGDRNAVTLARSTEFLELYGLVLDKADNFIFKDMTLSADNYRQIVHLKGGADNIEFNNIRFLMFPESNGLPNIITAEEGNNNDLRLINNLFRRGERALSFNGQNRNSPATGLLIEGNTFIDQEKESLKISQAKGVSVIGNNFTDTINTYNYYSIYLYQCDEDIKILNNIIALGDSGGGIDLFFCDGTAEKRGLIANNMMQVHGFPDEDLGLTLNYSGYQNIYHNSIHVTGSGANSRALNISNGSNVNILNNILAHSDQGYAIYTNSSSNINNCDYNNLYTTGTNVAYWAGTDLATLADWQQTSEKGTNSLFSNPLFLSPTDLHTQQTQLNGTALVLPEITTDFDGELRNTTNPDIGADEFTPSIQNDAGITAINPPTKPFSAGNQTIKTTIINNGTNNLTTTTVKWAVNGVAQTDYLWTGDLSSEGTEEITLGTYNFDAIDNHQITVYTSNPNNTADPLNGNDTLRLTDIYAALVGTYTIGGATPTFQNFTTAVTALNQRGVVGAVLLSVRVGEYEEQLIINEVLGASAVNTISFKGVAFDNSATRLHFDAEFGKDYVIQLDGADYITFENMTLEETAGTYNGVVKLINGANNNRFIDNHILTSSQENSNSVLILSTGSNFPNNATEVRGNKFTGTDAGIFSFQNRSIKENGWTIENNEFKNQENTAIHLRYQQNVVIVNNEIETDSTISPNTNSYIYLINIDNGLNVSKNKVILHHGFPLYVGNYNGNSSNNGLISNNFLVSNNPTSLTAGLQVNNSSYLNIFHNSIVLNESEGPSLHVDLSSSSTDIKIIGNIAANYGSGLAFYLNRTTSNNFQSDYNDFYNIHSNLIGLSSLRFSSLTDWQNYSFAQDAHSFNVNPVFDTPTDLHIANAELDNASIALAEVSEDIDGEPRDPNHPDIGADEFSISAYNDLGVTAISAPQKPFPTGVQPVKIVIENFGLDTLYSSAIRWAVNGLVQTDHIWSGTLFPEETDTITIGNYYFNGGNTYTIDANILTVNNRPDLVTSNNVFSVSELYPALIGTYTIGGPSPDFANFTKAIEALNLGGVIGAVEFIVRNGEYEEQIQLDSIWGVSENNNIIFRGETTDRTKVRLFSDSFQEVVEFSGADYITFQEMTIASTYSSNFSSTANISIKESSSNIQIKDCHIIAPSSNANYYGILLKGNNIKITGNTFEGNHYGVYAQASSASPLVDIFIENNLFLEPTRYGIYLYNVEHPTIHNNIVNTNTLESSSYSGIYCGCRAPIITNNQIYTNQSGLYLSFFGSNIPIEKGLVANNFISITGVDFASAFYLDNRNTDIYHNSILVANNGQGIGLQLGSANSDLIIQNNNIANTGGGYAIIKTGISSFGSMDYNNLYTTGNYLGQWKNTNTLDLAAWSQVSAQDAHSLSVNPNYFGNDDLHIVNEALDSHAIALPLITEDIDGEPRDLQHPDIGADEFDYVENDLKIIAINSPQTNCNLTNAETVTITLQNVGGETQTGFDLVYQANNSAAVLQNVGSFSIASGETKSFSFSTKLNAVAGGDYTLKAYPQLTDDEKKSNDTATVTITNYVLPPLTISNMLPTDGNNDVDKPTAFSWLPANGATGYDFYLWETTATKPEIPTYPDLTQISFTVDGDMLAYGVGYKWQIIAKNDFCSTEGPTQTFTLRELPNLKITNIEVPSMPFSGQTIQINWTTKNDGVGDTEMDEWTDAVYLSVDETFEPREDIYLGAIPNSTALNAGESYAEMGNFMLPDNIIGDNFIIIIADSDETSIESNETDNITIYPIDITLTPPPDLQVTAIIGPNNAFSSQDIEISWTVKNEGTGPTRTDKWRDIIYISEEEVFNSSNAQPLGVYEKNAFNPLAVNDTYTAAKTVRVPAEIDGDYFIHVLTDYQDKVYEHAFEGNNSNKKTINIVLTPPPDLVVQHIVFPDSVSTNQQQVNLQWQTKNIGASTADLPWLDRVYLSKNNIFYPDSSTLLTVALAGGVTDKIPHNNLVANSTITTDGTINIPDKSFGLYYLHIITDEDNNIFELDKESNNVQTTSFTILSPDLRINNVVANSTVGSGTEIDLEWQVWNDSKANIEGTRINDRIFLSADNTFDPTTDQEIGRLSYLLNLADGGMITKQETIAIPDGIAGTYTIFVITDWDDKIYEVDEINNSNSQSIIIELSPWSDLEVIDLMGLPTNTLAGSEVTINFTIQNKGEASTGTKAWKDGIYISAASTWNPNAAIRLKSLSVQEILNTDSTYTVTQTFRIPMLPGVAPTGVCFIYIYTDDENQIYEHTSEGNNTLRSHGIAVTAPPPVDMAITSITTLPDTLQNGDKFEVAWTVTNNGSSTDLWNYPLWYDGLYLSADNLVDGSDVLVKDYTEAGPLEMDGTYSDNQSFTIPNGIAGDYYFILSADHLNYTQDGNRIDNTHILDNTSNPSNKIFIKSRPAPDLAITTFDAPAVAQIGQPITLSVEVINNGEGATWNNWKDKIYLSTDLVIDENDLILKTEFDELDFFDYLNQKPNPLTHTTVVSPQEKYTAEAFEAYLPPAISGNYILLFKTDAGNAQYEADRESNNVFYRPITINDQEPSDLIVEEMECPAMVIVGEEMTIKWSVKNIGAVTTPGFKRDIVYLSKDSLFDVTDIRLGIQQGSARLAPMASRQDSLKATVPGLALGDYYVIVQTDALNNIVETNDTNNVLISTHTVMITVEELVLAEAKNRQMQDDELVFYRIEVPDNLKGETMQVTLSGATNGFNELYVSYETVPSKVNHQFVHEEIFKPTQQIIVPEIMAGTYYVLATGATNSGVASQQAISVLAEIIPFDIHSVNTNKGGNTGTVTVQIKGARFEEGMSIRLEGQINVIGQNINLLNSTELFVTFDLSLGGCVPIGMYDVVIEKEDASVATLADGFEVIEGGLSNLEVSISHPPNTRINRVVPMSINFVNNGANDIAIPKVAIISERGAPIALTREALEYKFLDVVFELFEEGGSTTVLRPGAFGNVTIYAFSSEPLTFRMIQIE